MTHDNDGISRLYHREPSWVSKIRALFGGRRSVLRKTIAEQRVLLEEAEAERIKVHTEWSSQMTRVAASWANYSRDLEADRESLAEVSRVLAESLVVRWKPKTVEAAARRVLNGTSPDRGRAVGVMIEAFDRSERARALKELL